MAEFISLARQEKALRDEIATQRAKKGDKEALGALELRLQSCLARKGAVSLQLKGLRAQTNQEALLK